MGKQPNNKVLIIGGAAVVIILGGVVWALMGSDEPAQPDTRPPTPAVAAGDDLSDGSVGSMSRSAPQQTRDTGRLGAPTDQETTGTEADNVVMPKSKTKKAPKKRRGRKKLAPEEDEQTTKAQGAKKKTYGK